MSDGKRGDDVPEKRLPESGDIAERAFESGIDPGAFDAEGAVEADIAAANSDVEAAAEDMGAEQSRDAAQPGQPTGAPIESTTPPLFQAWPSVRPTLRRSMAEEADAFFAFTERLRQESAQEFSAGGTDHWAPTPVDRPDPADDALIGPVDGLESTPDAEDDSGAITAVPYPHEDQDSAGEEHDQPDQHGPDEDGRDHSVEYVDEDGFDQDDFYVGDDSYDEDVDVEVEVDADSEAEEDESAY